MSPCRSSRPNSTVKTPSLEPYRCPPPPPRERREHRNASYQKMGGSVIPKVGALPKALEGLGKYRFLHLVCRPHHLLTDSPPGLRGRG